MSIMRKLGFLKGKKFMFHSVTVLIAVQTLAWRSQAQNPITLSDNNSAAVVDTANGGGMTSWIVDGQNQLNQQWFWYRIGDTAAGNPNQKINALNATPLVSQPLANILKTTYIGEQLRVEINYTLNGQDPGSYGADIQETIKLKNISSSAYTLHFFQYSDFNLGGNPLGDSVQLNVDSGSGRFSGATQFKQSSGSSLIETAQTSDIPFPNHGETDFYGATLSRLAGSYDLNDSSSAGPGDVTWALEWDLGLAPGQTISISKDKLFSGVMVPEPSIFGLISVGTIAIAVQRRGRGK
jgi:hypothetical protein